MMRVRLGDYIEEYSVRNKKQDEIPVYSVTNTQGFCRDYFSKDVASKNKSTYKIVPHGYFAYNPSRVNVGSIDWLREADRVIVSPLYVVFSVSDAIDQQYLLYYLKSDIALHLIRERASGSVRDNLKFSILSEFPIILRDKEAQLRIVKTLDLLENLIRINKAKLGKLDDLVKSRFVEMFGDPVLNPNGYPKLKLSEIASYYGGLTYRPSDVAEEGGTIVLRSANIQNGSLSFKDVVRVSCKIKDKLYVKQNDILMCSRNGSARLVGKTALIKDLVEPMSFGAFMMIIRSEYYPYLLSYLRTQAFRSQVQTGTATINQITGRMLDSVVLPIPPIQLVREFATFVSQVDKSRFAVQQAIEQLETLKASLMQEYFG